MLSLAGSMSHPGQKICKVSSIEGLLLICSDDDFGSLFFFRQKKDLFDLERKNKKHVIFNLVSYLDNTL